MSFVFVSVVTCVLLLATLVLVSEMVSEMVSVELECVFMLLSNVTADSESVDDCQTSME